jgi:hypothetical protein
MKKILFLFIILNLAFTACAQVPEEYAGEIDSNYTEYNNYSKQYCIDQKIDNIWYSYIDDRIESETYGDYGWKNTSNDEIMVPAQYMMIFYKCHDSAKSIGFAGAKEGTKGIWYWTPDGEKILQAYIFDNGPDYFEEGLSRYIENEKIGFINENLEIVIPAQFDGAWPFENGTAKVCNGCEKVYIDEFKEYYTYEGGTWGKVDKNGTVTWDE